MISALNNPAGLIAANQYAKITRAIGTNLERLSTGKRINRASDDPAGMVAVDQLKTQREAIKAKMDRLEFEASYVGSRDGARSVVSDMLTDLTGWIVTAANTAGQTRDEREALQTQVDSVLSTIDQLALTTTFNGQSLLQGQQAANLGVTLTTVTNPDGSTTTVRRSLADLRRGGALNLLDGDLAAAQDLVKGLTTSYASERAALGARGREIDSQLRVLSDEYANLTDAQSRIEDTDYAQEVSLLVRNQVLQQAAALAMKLAKDSGPQRVLDLLKPLR